MIARGRTDRGILRLCLDLNIWVADLLAHASGGRGTAAQTLVDIVRDGTCSLGPTQLVISWGMLDRLGEVLIREFRVPSADVTSLLSSIATIAQKGPTGVAPYVLLGGTGVIPLRDTEDRAVLETALAAGADVLVTSNFRDFLDKRARVVVRNSAAVIEHAGGSVIVAVPSQMLAWVRAGAIGPV